MTAFTFELINGLKVGIEHVTFDDDDGVDWVVVLDLLIFRFCFLRYSDEE